MQADEPNGDAHAGRLPESGATLAATGLLGAAVNAAPVTFGAICSGFAGGAVIALSVGAHPSAGVVGAALFGFPAMLLEKHVVNRDGPRRVPDAS